MAEHQQQSQSGGKRPSHDLIRLDADGKFAKVTKEIDGVEKQVNDVCGAAWADDLGENSALIKLEDGSRFKLMSRSKLEAHRAANPKPAAKKPAKKPATRTAPPKSPTQSKFGRK